MNDLDKVFTILNALKTAGHSIIYYYHYSQEATDILIDLMLIRG
jgi:ABC-type multidrug transport system ATPase subunit